MKVRKIYLAGPLFTSAERMWNRRLAEWLRISGYKVWLPQGEEPEPNAKTAKAIFDQDVKGIDWSDVVVAIMDGPDPDSGTSWECGYAYAKGKLVLQVRTDFRGIGDGFAPYNLMLTESANGTRILPMADVTEVASEIIDFLKDYQ